MSNVEKDFGVITNDPLLKKRTIEICKEFEFEYEIWDDLDSFAASGKQPKLLIASVSVDNERIEVSEVAQMVRHAARDPFLICTTPAVLTKDMTDHARKSGVDLVLIDDEVINSSKLEFISSLVIRSRHLPIKPSDLFPSKPLPFDLYHLLPQRMKFLKMAFTGDLLNSRKMKKVNEIGEVYIDRDSAQKFNEYIAEGADNTAEGFEKRCRGQFLALSSEFSKLVLQLTSQSEHATFGEGQALLTRCSELCNDLLKTLTNGGAAWRIVNNSAVGTFGALERAPAIAAYTGLFAQLFGWTSVADLMLAALLSDLGMLFLPPPVLKKVRDDNVKDLTAEERTTYEGYPQTSLSIILDRKLSIPEKMRTWIISTQERADSKGFPKQVSGTRLTQEAKMISFCREFDRRTLLKMGKQRQEPLAVLEQMGNDRGDLVQQFGTEFIFSVERLVKLVHQHSEPTPQKDEAEKPRKNRVVISA